METSEKITPTEIFDDIWPLILQCNKCDIMSQNKIKYFIPQRKFDYMWAHEFLASKCYADYEPPVILGCKHTTEPEAEDTTEDEIEQLPYRGSHSNIIPLDQQLATIQKDVEIRKKLAYDFANRKFPWYIQRPSYLLDFKITDDMKNVFKDPFEYQILNSIQHFKCHLMILDLAVDVSAKYLERWLKFSPYVMIVTVVHDEHLYKVVKSFNKVFEPVLTEENIERNWQEELNCSLKRGVLKAKEELFAMDDASKAFVFVFAHNRGLCVCDKFKILRIF